MGFHRGYYNGATVPSAGLPSSSMTPGRITTCSLFAEVTKGLHAGPVTSVTTVEVTTTVVGSNYVGVVGCGVGNGSFVGLVRVSGVFV